MKFNNISVPWNFVAVYWITKLKKLSLLGLAILSTLLCCAGLVLRFLTDNPNVKSAISIMTCVCILVSMLISMYCQINMNKEDPDGYEIVNALKQYKNCHYEWLGRNGSQICFKEKGKDEKLSVSAALSNPADCLYFIKDYGQPVKTNATLNENEVKFVIKKVGYDEEMKKKIVECEIVQNKYKDIREWVW